MHNRHFFPEDSAHVCLRGQSVEQLRSGTQRRICCGAWREQPENEIARRIRQKKQEPQPLAVDVCAGFHKERQFVGRVL